MVLKGLEGIIFDSQKTKATIGSPRTSQSKPKREIIISIGIINKNQV